MINKNIENDEFAQIKYSFTYKTFHERVCDYFRLYNKHIPKLITIFTTGWALIEIILYEKKITVLEHFFLISLIAIISLCISLYDNFKSYKNNVPDCLAKENEKIKNIFVSQKIGWQYRLTHEMLSIRILKHELALSRIKQGAEFIYPKILSENDYIEYLKLKPLCLDKLAHAIKTTCFEILTNSFENVKHGEPDKISILVNEIEHFSSLYEQTVLFETSIYEVFPLEKFAKLHTYLFDWTETLRNGMQQFEKIIETLAKINNKKAIKNIGNSMKSITIEFASPSNFKNFSSELDDLIREKT
jgi:hypothetical protein